MHLFRYLLMIEVVSSLGLGEKDDSIDSSIDGDRQTVFSEYESCINKKVRMMSLNSETPVPEAVIVQRGGMVRLKCQPCLRPDKEVTQMDVLWYRIRPELNDAQLVPIGTLNYESDREQHTLIITSAGDIHSAHYTCIHRGIAESSYYLEVIRHETKKLVSTQGKMRRPAEDRVYKDKNIRLYTDWAEWSECSACGKIGFRRRTGTCTVQKIYPSLPSKPTDSRALSVFLKGLPCQSSSARLLQKEIKAISRRKSEILIDYCYTPCPTTAPSDSVRNITDKYGYLIERVEGKDVYRLDETRPALPPMVHRETHYLPPRAKIHFTCPQEKLNAKYEKTRIRWENGSRVIFPMSIRRSSGGRVYIDNMNRLQFRSVWPVDSGYYSCWQDGWLVAVFHIVCKKSVITNNQIPDIIFYLGALLAILTVFCIACHMWRSSKDKRYQ